MIERGEPGERDRAADRAASAARTLAAVAHDAARQHVKRDAVTTHLYRDDAAMVAAQQRAPDRMSIGGVPVALDVAERERQARLRRWHTPAHPNRKDG